VPETAARVASLPAASSVPTAEAATAATVATATAAVPATIAAALGAVTRNVADLPALVALLAAGGAAEAARATARSSRAVAGQMAWVAAVVAGLRFVSIIFVVAVASEKLIPCLWPAQCIRGRDGQLGRSCSRSVCMSVGGLWLMRWMLIPGYPWSGSRGPGEWCHRL